MRIFLSILMLLAATTASAGERVVGNGGDGVVIGGRLYLLDLVEGGNHENPYIGPNRTSKKNEEVLAKALKNIPVEIELVSRKIRDVEKVSHTTAVALLYAIKFYNWRLVSYELANVEDEDTAVGLPLHQIAIRKQQQILINKKLFSAMDPANRVALIFHEAVYALLQPIKVWDELVQPSYDARRINLYLFEEGMTLEGLKETVKRFGDSEHEFLPVREQLGFVPDVNQTYPASTSDPGEIIVLDRQAFVRWWEKLTITETTGSGIFRRPRTRETEGNYTLLYPTSLKKTTLQEIDRKCAYYASQKRRTYEMAVLHYEHQIGFWPSVAAGGQTYLDWNMSGAFRMENRTKYKYAKNIKTKEQCKAFVTAELKKVGLIKN